MQVAFYENAYNPTNYSSSAMQSQVTTGYLRRARKLMKSGFAMSPHSQQKLERKQSKQAKLALKTYFKVGETFGIDEIAKYNSFFKKRVSTAE